MIDKDKLEMLTEFATTRAIPKVQIDTEDLIALCEDAAMLRKLTVDVKAERPVYLSDLKSDDPVENVMVVAGVSRLRGGL